MEAPHLDHLNAFFANDKIAQREILTDFIDLVPNILAEIEKGILQNEVNSIKKLLHSLYPNLYYVGLTQSQQIAKQYAHDLNPDVPIPFIVLNQLCQNIRAALPQILILRDTVI